MLFALLFCSISLGILGFLVKEKKCYNLIAGYNTLPEEEKSKVNIERLANTLGIVFYILSAIFITLCICSFLFDLPDVYILMMTFFFTFLGLNIIVLRRDEKTKRNPKTIVFLVVLDIIGVLSIAFLLFDTLM